MNDRLTGNEIKALAAEIAQRIAQDDSEESFFTPGGKLQAVCPPKKLCCFQGYNCDAPFVCPDGFRCPNGFGAGVIGTRG